MSKPPTCAELDAKIDLQDQRFDAVEDAAEKAKDDASTTRREHEVRIAKLEIENAVLKAANERLENRVWAMLFTSFFAVCTALTSVLVALVKK